MGNDPQRRELLLVDELGDVVHELRRCVRGPCAPLRVTVTAQVRRDDVVPVLEVRGGPVPVVGMIAVAVDEQQRRGVRVAPVEVVQPKPLREVRVRRRARHPGRLPRSNPRAAAQPRPSRAPTEAALDCVSPNVHGRHRRNRSGRQPSCNQWRVTTRNEIGVEARHRRQPASDRARRQTRITISQPDHDPIPALLGQELEHIQWRHRHRIAIDDREEHLQIERHRAHRVRATAPATNSR